MRAALAEEASGLIARLGFQGPARIRAVPIYLVLIGIFGVFLPWQRGRSFLDAVVLGAYACLGVVFAAPSASSPFDGRPTISRAGARIAISVFYGELLAVTMLLGLVATFYLRSGCLPTVALRGAGITLAVSGVFFLGLSTALSGSKA